MFNALSAGLVMGIMILPDRRVALRGRPRGRSARSARRAPTRSAAPATRSRPRVTFPAALSGIVASFVLGVSRAIGETMIVLIAAGGYAEPHVEPR